MACDDFPTISHIPQDQAAFLNCAVLLDIDSNSAARQPSSLLRHLQDMEHSIGRQKSFRNGPRLIDMDILCITTNGGINLDVDISASDSTTELLVPHPRIEERAFVLQPLVRKVLVVPDFYKHFLRGIYSFRYFLGRHQPEHRHPREVGETVARRTTSKRSRCASKSGSHWGRRGGHPTRALREWEV